MKVEETGPVDGKKRKQVLLGNGEEKKKAFRKRRVQVSFIQRVFQTCKTVFKGPGTVPSSSDVQTLHHLLDKMKAEDVDLSKDLCFWATGEVGSPRATCSTIYKCENFSMCIFFLPATAVIPLHNHPGMTVFSKLLLGSMHVKSYDWVQPTSALPASSSPSATATATATESPRARQRLARLNIDSTFTAPCATSVLFPTSGGNIHTFTAVTPCAFLDVLGPPYSADDGRDCTYYADHPYSGGGAGAEEDDEEAAAAGRYGWLEEIGITEEQKMLAVEYSGPPIIDS